MSPEHPTSFEEILGKAVHISLSHLSYSGELLFDGHLAGLVSQIAENRIIVSLADSKGECHLRRDLRIFESSTVGGYNVYVGCVGTASLRDLTKCIYARKGGRRASKFIAISEEAK